jgi:hypothetical protein
MSFLNSRVIPITGRNAKIRAPLQGWSIRSQGIRNHARVRPLPIILVRRKHFHLRRRKSWEDAHLYNHFTVRFRMQRSDWTRALLLASLIVPAMVGKTYFPHRRQNQRPSTAPLMVSVSLYSVKVPSRSTISTLSDSMMRLMDA